MEATCDPFVFIESRGEATVIYVMPTSGERWQIDGVCNQCGACWDGAVGAAPVLDCPVRPEIASTPRCVLSGRYLPPVD